MSVPALHQRPAWAALKKHHQKMKRVQLRQLFAKDHQRGERLAVEAAGLYFDYSKNRISDETMKLLLQLAQESGLRDRIDAMFRGDKINTSEKRAALHVALRAPRGGSILHDGQNVVPEVHAVLDKMADFSQRVRSGTWKGHTGKRIRNVINVGIGGSDLGPVMAYEALKHYSERSLTFRFVSNVDGMDFAEAVLGLDPAETLFIISSKTFTTVETMTNAHTARDWLLAGLNREPSAALHPAIRSSRFFQSGLFGWKPPLSDTQTAEIAASKQIIYDGFRSALAGGAPAGKAGILVDEQFGAAILLAAAAAGIATACPAERSGQDEFDFEYGKDFARHIEAFKPTFCKVLVRYNPEGDRALNQRQAGQLKRLSDYLAARDRSRFMFELLVPPEKQQLDRLKGDKKAYDLELRPRLMAAAMRELQAAGVEPDLWKIEGLDRAEDCQAIVAAARADGRDDVGCIVLGRGEDDHKVRGWLSVAAKVPGFIGFAVDRTVFWNPLVAWHAGKATREDAATQIASRYREFVDLFEES
jgi:myo-inositol catabolism protein IolC